MEEMVYPDGVSFENSTAYHCLIMELFTYSAILCKRNDLMAGRVHEEIFWFFGEDGVEQYGQL